MCGMHSTGESYDDFFFSFCKEKLWFSEENREKLERKEVLKRVKICNSHWGAWEWGTDQPGGGKGLYLNCVSVAKSANLIADTGVS